MTAKREPTSASFWRAHASRPTLFGGLRCLLFKIVLAGHGPVTARSGPVKSWSRPPAAGPGPLSCPSPLYALFANEDSFAQSIFQKGFSLSEAVNDGSGKEMVWVPKI
jgi:hypothetical protein